MLNNSTHIILALLISSAAAQEASAIGIGLQPCAVGNTTLFNIPSAAGFYAWPELFNAGGSTFGADLDVFGGLWTAEDRRRSYSVLPVTMRPSVPADLVSVHALAEADLNFFGQGIDLLTLRARATRENGAFSRAFTINVAGIDLYSGTNSLTSTMRTIGPYSQVFYTAVQSYGVATARANLLGEIGMTARGVANATSGLHVEGRLWSALILEGTAGVSVGFASAGLYAAVDLLEVGMDFNHRIGLTSGSTFDFYSTYDARTMDGWVALRGSALVGTVDVWSDSWNGFPISQTTLYDQAGCIR